MTINNSYALFPQINSLNEIKNQSNNNNIQYNSSSIYHHYPITLSYSQHQHKSMNVLDPSEIGYYDQQLQVQNISFAAANSISENNEACSVVQSYLSPNSLCLSHIESPILIQSDSFNQQQDGVTYYSTFNSTIDDMTLLTPPTKYYDISVQPTANYIHPIININNTNVLDYQMLNMNHTSRRSSTQTKATEEKKNINNTLYHCEFPGCTKTFTRTYNLKSHRRTHTDEKPFACSMCSKAFARQHDRNRHEKLHLGLKPYPCQFCHKSFARLDALNRHLKRDSKTAVDTNIEIQPPPCLLGKLKKKQKATLKRKRK